MPQFREVAESPLIGVFDIVILEIELRWRPCRFDLWYFGWETDAVEVAFYRSAIGDGGYNSHLATAVRTDLHVQPERAGE